MSPQAPSIPTTFAEHLSHLLGKWIRFTREDLDSAIAQYSTEANTLTLDVTSNMYLDMLDMLCSLRQEMNRKSDTTKEFSALLPGDLSWLGSIHTSASQEVYQMGWEWHWNSDEEVVAQKLPTSLGSTSSLADVVGLLGERVSFTPQVLDVLIHSRDNNSDQMQCKYMLASLSLFLRGAENYWTENKMRTVQLPEKDFVDKFNANALGTARSHLGIRSSQSNVAVPLDMEWKYGSAGTTVSLESVSKSGQDGNAQTVFNRRIYGDLYVDTRMIHPPR